MIIREITKDRERVLNSFDWFNDYRDTRDYVKSLGDKETVDLLDNGFEDYISKIRQKKIDRDEKYCS